MISCQPPPEQTAMIERSEMNQWREHQSYYPWPSARLATTNQLPERNEDHESFWNAVFNSEVSKAPVQDMKKEHRRLARSGTLGRRHEQLQIVFPRVCAQHEGAQTVCWPRSRCCGVSSSAKIGLQRPFQLITPRNRRHDEHVRNNSGLGPIKNLALDGVPAANPVLTQNRKPMIFG